MESLRFILALVVMQSHLRIADWSFKFFYNGNLAVIFFFLLSGFGMAYKSFCNSKSGELKDKWSFIKEYKHVFMDLKKLYFWYMLFILLSLPWQFYDLSAWHDKIYATAGTLATIVITPTMLQSIFGFYQGSHLGHYALTVHIGGILGLIPGLNEIGRNILLKFFAILLLPVLCYYMRKHDIKKEERKIAG